MEQQTGGPEAWGEWLRDRLEELGWRQADLVSRSGGLIKRDRASKWFRGIEAPTHRLAVVAANTLDASRADALRAAGFTPATQEEQRELDLEVALNTITSSSPRFKLEHMLRDVPDSEILHVLRMRALKREGSESRPDSESAGHDVSGAIEDQDPHEIDLSQGDVDLAASTDNSAVLDQKQPDYENESQDPEEER